MAKRSFGKATPNRPRKAGVRPQYLKVLIVTEGEVTERQYFEFVRDQLSAFGANIRCVPGKADPLTMVKRAIELRSLEADAYGKSGGYDETWVVVDVDEHPQLPAALREARINGIKVAVSNPCFELWLLLHHKEHTSHQLTSAMTELWRSVSGSTNKSVDPRALVGRFDDAERRARKNRLKHERDGNTHPDDNPTTTVDLLVRRLLDAARASSNKPELSL